MKKVIITGVIIISSVMFVSWLINPFASSVDPHTDVDPTKMETVESAPIPTTAEIELQNAINFYVNGGRGVKVMRIDVYGSSEGSNRDYINQEILFQPFGSPNRRAMFTRSGHYHSGEIEFQTVRNWQLAVGDTVVFERVLPDNLSEKLLDNIRLTSVHGRKVQ